MKLLRLVVMASLCSHLWCASLQAQDWSDRQLAVAYIRVHRTGVTDETVAAVYVGANEQNAYFVTAYHAVKKDENGPVGNVDVQFKDHPETITGKVLSSFDPDLDVAVIQVPLQSIPSNIPKLSVRQPSLSLPIHIIGHPPGGRWSAWDGTVQNVNAPGGDAHHFTTNADPSLVGGFSGGPVVDSAGALVGMHVAGTSSYGLAVKSVDIVAQLAAWNVPHNNLSTQKVTVSISPSNPPSMHFGEKQTFTANVSGTDQTAITWSSSKGHITSAGIFTAPNEVGDVAITATSKADATKNASVTVSVAPQQFKCVLVVHGVQAGLNQDVSWSIDGTNRPALKTHGTANAISQFACDSGDHDISVQLTASVQHFHQIGGSKPSQSCEFSFTVRNKAVKIVVDPQGNQDECSIDQE